MKSEVFYFCSEKMEFRTPGLGITNEKMGVEKTSMHNRTYLPVFHAQ